MWYEHESVYKEKFEDPNAIYFTKEAFPELADEENDVSGILQSAIDKLVETQVFGIIYIPEGRYPIRDTVLIPPAVRLIGYGGTRPLFYLPGDAEGFDGDINIPSYESMDPSLLSADGSLPGAKYMFWFIGDRDTKALSPRDANAATFYSAISNIDFKIEGRHPGAVCIRARFAQHSFVSHAFF